MKEALVNVLKKLKGRPTILLLYKTDPITKEEEEIGYWTGRQKKFDGKRYAEVYRDANHSKVKIYKHHWLALRGFGKLAKHKGEHCVLKCSMVEKSSS